MDERSARRNQETGCHNGLRGLAASQPRMRADTHDGPEQIAPLQRPDTLMQLSRSSILEVHLVRTAGPYIWHEADMPMAPNRGCFRGQSRHGLRVGRPSIESEATHSSAVRVLGAFTKIKLISTVRAQLKLLVSRLGAVRSNRTFGGHGAIHQTREHQALQETPT